MDSIIPLGQKNTLTEYMILFGVNNHPPMLDKDLYDSWKSIIELYMQNREHGRIILESVENGPLIWPTIVENGMTRTKKYAELSAAEKIQANCDMKETNIILQGFAVLEFPPKDDPIACLNKAIAFLIDVASLRSPSTNNQLRTFLKPRNQATIQDGRVTVQGLSNATTVKVKDIWLGNALSLSDQGMQHDLGVPDGQAAQTIIPNNSAFQTEDFDTYDSNCDDISNAKAVLMANIFNYESDVILEAQQDSMILFVIKQVSEQMINHVNNWEKANKEHNNKSVTTELERYKERVKTFEQRFNIDLNSREKMIDSQMDDMIKEKLALKEQVDSRYQNPFYLKKAQRIKPTLYDGIVIYNKHVDMHVIDDEETLILDEDVLLTVMKSLSLNGESDLKAQIQDKVFVITSLKNNLQKLKGKEIVNIAAQKPSTNTIVLGMFKLDLDPLAPKLLQNKEAHIDYLKHTQEQADILQGIVEQAKAKQPLDNALDFACKHAQRIKELLVYVQDTYPNAIKLSEKGLKCSTSNCGSKPTCNKNSDRISQTPSRNMKNKVEAQPKKVNKKNHVVEPIHDLGVKQSQLNANSKLICATWNRSQLMNFVSKFMGTVRFGNDHIARIIRFLRIKDEAPEAIIKCIKNIQVHLNATVRNVRTDNGTEFVNQTLREFYENVGISHQVSTAHTPQQNGVVKSSLIRLRYNKAPYELMQDKKPDLSLFHVFGSLCYPTNDNEDLGKLDAKDDIALAFEQLGSGPGLKCMTLAISISGLVSNPVSQQPCIPPNRDDWDRLFQPMFDEYFNPLTIVVSPVPLDATSRDIDTADSHVSALIYQDAPSANKVMLIKLKWIYKVKMDEFGGVLKNKARLVDQGFRKEEDADHAGFQDNRRSTSGSAQFLGDKLVSWSSKKQKSTVILGTEAEYIALSGSFAQIL
nr:integrase, catalytic region, zinc finger, CCHC-type, peptidase aspartic, catalytic [Tanacetum cinerariifolium]